LRPSSVAHFKLNPKNNSAFIWEAIVSTFVGFPECVLKLFASSYFVSWLYKCCISAVFIMQTGHIGLFAQNRGVTCLNPGRGQVFESGIAALMHKGVA